MRCDNPQLEHILMHADEDSAEFRTAALHVESCPRCRERLADLSGTDSLTAEACQMLRDRGEPTFDPTIASASFVIAVESLLGDECPIDCETVPLDFLEPARHPEMLGRIGRYDVERLIGAGGMGVVLKAFDTDLHRVVAVKVLLPHLAHSSAARQRFAREAQAAAAIVHEHVIPIYNVGSDAAIPYLVMQFVPGHSLQTRVDESGPLDIKDVLRIARQAAAGLEAAHAQGVMHRDVKPANILLEESVDRVLISDFGLARTVDDATLTRTGVLAGTPHYMSPEQASGKTMDHRSDLFSLGSVIYFMCTGAPPFQAESPMGTLNRICHEPHRPADEVNSAVPFDLADLIDRLLAKDPAQRFLHAREVESRCAALLADLQQGRPPRRRRFLRWRRNRTLVKRLTIAAAGSLAGIVFMLVGAWLTRVFVPPKPAPVVNKPIDETPSVDVPTPPLRSVSRDTFDKDLLETRRLVEAAESPKTQGAARLDRTQDKQWQNDVDELRAKLTRRLGSLPTSQQATSSQTQPVGPALTKE
jgi:eukaryotic-like serine/threonine-protein kinase